MLRRKLAPELVMSQTNLAGMVQSVSDERERSEEAWMLEVSGKLVAIFAQHGSRPLTGDDVPLQAVRYLTRKLEAESGCERWREGRLESRGFAEGGGWRAMIVKLHQVLAGIWGAWEISSDQTVSNEWDCLAVTARIHDMHANHKLVENFVDKVNISPVSAQAHKLLVRFVPGAVSRVTVEEQEGILEIPCELLWYAVQASGRFDAQMEEFVRAQLGARSAEAAHEAVALFTQAQYSDRVFGEKFGWYCLVLSQQGQDLRSLVAEIRTSVKLAGANPSDKTARRRLETLLVLMRGHEEEDVRMEAEVLLHMFQDGHDWQAREALPVSYGYVDERVQIAVPACAGDECVLVELCGPLLGPEVRTAATEVVARFWTRPGVTLRVFPSRCGFYDYRVSSGSRGETLKSGRVVVHAGELRRLQLKELSLATSADLRGAVEEAMEDGYTGFVLSEAGAEGNRSHTQPDLKRLLKQTSEQTCGLYVAQSLHVSALRSHRKYRDLFVQRMTRAGLAVTQSLLNYRLLDTWELLVEELAVWARDCGAKGARLFEGYADAPMYVQDLEELLRKDEDDGRLHYEVLDVLSGLLVKTEPLPMKKDAAYGSAFYARTLRELWRRFPEFTLFVDAQEAEAASLARSGVVPVVHGRVGERRTWSSADGPRALRVADEELKTATGEVWALTGPEIPVVGKAETQTMRELQRLRRGFVGGEFVGISENAWAWRAKPGTRHGAALTIFVVNHGRVLGGATLTKTFPLRDLLGSLRFPFYVESGLTEADGQALWALEELEETEFELSVPAGEFVVRTFRGAESLGGRRAKTLLRESMQRCGSHFQRQLAEALKAATDGPFRKLFSRVRGVGDLGLWRRNVAGVFRETSEAERGWSRCVAMLQSTGELGLLEENQLGSVVFVTPELGRWSTAGGLGVMVDELSSGLGGRFLEEVLVISPYYDRNSQGEYGYLEKDGIRWILNVDVYVGDECVTLGVHEGRVNNVRVVFLHNAKYFPVLYPQTSAAMTVAFLVVLAKGSLEVCRRLGVCPGTVVTNDWATGLVAAYGKREAFFSSTRFLHIIHNLDPSYEGRIYPSRAEETLGHLHRLPTELLVDPHWSSFCLNPSRCALLSSDQWGTVSRSYREELLAGSPLNALLRLHARPFAHPNGIPLEPRLERLRATGVTTQKEAKRAIQQKYFGFQVADDEMALLGFVGRITQQKGVHMIADIAEQIMRRFNFRVQIFVAGKGTVGDPYSEHCVGRLWDLRRRFPRNFWADPNLFFRDGPLLNLASDFGLMPSMFEPGGIVQQEFFVAGTPVIAFKTGGLKDTVKEFFDMNDGNGFTFEAYSSGDFAFAIDRAMKTRADAAACERLRENARASVVTCEMVGRAWLTAMYDLHGKFFVDKLQVEKEAIQIAKEEVEISEGDDEESRKSENSLEEPGTPKSASTLPMSRVFSTSSVSSVLVTKKQVRVCYRVPFGLAKPHQAVLCGSFDNWGARYPMIWDARIGAFAVDLRLSVGNHAVKVVSDGVWRTMPDYPVVRDETGNENNLLSVN